MVNVKFLSAILLLLLLSSCKDTESSISPKQKVELDEGISNQEKTERTQEEIKNATIVESTDSKVNPDWLHFDDLVAFDNTENKKYIVDVYTSWCGWCKIMDKQTFADEQFQAYISDKFHLVKFNAEQTEPVLFKGKTYEWQEGGRKGINSLALELLQGRLSYPSLVYLDEDLNIINVSSGFKKTEQLINELELIQ